MNKRVAISLGIIAILLIYYLIANYHKSEDIIELQGWQDDVDEILLKKGEDRDGTIRIYKKEGKWVINEPGYIADDSIVTTMTDEMKELKQEMAKRGTVER